MKRTIFRKLEAIALSAGFVLLLSSCLLFSSCAKEIRAIESLIERIENESIADLEMQIDKIKRSLKDLEETDEQLDGYIQTLQTTAANLQTALNATNEALNQAKSELKTDISNEKAAVLAELTSARTAIEGQITQINAAITALQAKDVALDKRIDTLSTYVNTLNQGTKDWASATFSTLEQYQATTEEITAIKTTITSLNGSMTELEARLNTKIGTDIAAAVSTLEGELATKVTELTTAYTNAISTAKTEITSAYTTAIANAISASETSMKEWVNEQLTGYYTIADAEGKLDSLHTVLNGQLSSQQASIESMIGSLEAQLTARTGENEKTLDTLRKAKVRFESALAATNEAVAANTKSIDSLRVNLKNAKEELTESYTAAINTAINILDGKLTGEVATAIAAVNTNIDTKIAAINTEITSLKNRVGALETAVSTINAQLDDHEARLAELEKAIFSIQSIVVVPDYSDGSVKMTSGDNNELRFEVYPTAAAQKLAEVGTSAFSLDCVETETKASIFTNIPITSVSFDGEVLSITADGSGLKVSIKDGTQPANARLRITDGKVTRSSEYFALTYKKPVYPTAASLTDFNEEISVGKSFSASLSYTPSSATWKEFTVNSSNAFVATAEKKGDQILVTGKSAGSATITVTWEGENGVKHYIVKVLTVHAPEPSIAWTTDMAATFGLGLIVGEAETVDANVSNLINKSVVYSSSNPNVATVDENTGAVAAKSSGWFTITATSVANSSVKVSSESIRVYGKPASIKILNASVDDGWFVRYQTTKSINVQIVDASGEASRQDLLRFSITTSDLKLNYNLTSANNSMMTLTVTGTRTTATSTIMGEARLYVQGYSDVQKVFDIYDSMYDKYDIKPFDGIEFLDNGALAPYDGGYRGSGYFENITFATGWKGCSAVVFWVGEHPQTNLSMRKNLTGGRYISSRPFTHGLAVAVKNARKSADEDLVKWWTVSQKQNDAVNWSENYTIFWAAGNPGYGFSSVSTFNKRLYGYEITQAMKFHNEKVKSNAKYTVIPVKNIVDYMDDTYPETGYNSGWYLPTSGEWYMMLHCLDGATVSATFEKINEYIKKTSGWMTMGETVHYWSCQEAYNDPDGMAVYMTGKSATAEGTDPALYKAKQETCKVRPFIAF